MTGASRQSEREPCVQRMVGHSKPSITLEDYGELWDDSQEQLATKLDEAIRAEWVA
jgi:hypothetical protein